MTQDAIDDPVICNKGDDLHAGVTGADQRVELPSVADDDEAGPE
jgi:hypothetical protein